MVELFSAATSTSVWRKRSWIAVGSFPNFAKFFAFLDRRHPGLLYKLEIGINPYYLFPYLRLSEFPPGEKIEKRYRRTV